MPKAIEKFTIGAPEPVADSMLSAGGM